MPGPDAIANHVIGARNLHSIGAPDQFLVPKLAILAVHAVFAPGRGVDKIPVRRLLGGIDLGKRLAMRRQQKRLMLALMAFDAAVDTDIARIGSRVEKTAFAV